MLKLFNTLTRKKEKFESIKEGIVHIYSCGPTVYDFAHIGNFKAYITVDILKRYLEYKGFKVKHVMNITDIDDKTIKRSGEENIPLKEFTKKYTKEFFKDIETMNIKKADICPRATEHVEEMIKVTRALIKKGFAYKRLNSVYFDVSKFKNYGKLSKVDLSRIKAGARIDVDEYEKEHPSDFALMKRSKQDEIERKIYYKTEWGEVRPGWHIECSVMSMKYLGETFDIHTGGVDLIFPHHENEIAQSEAYTGKKFVNYWVHNQHLIVEGKKMSKSLGNFYTLRDLLEKGYPPKAIRYILLATHYRQQLNFTFKGLEGANATVKRLTEFISRIKELKTKSNARDNAEIKNLIAKTKKQFEIAMDDDLEISGALASLFDFVKEINKLIAENKLSSKNAIEVYGLMVAFDKVLGILEEEEIEIPEEIKELVTRRESVREKKDWKEADELRKKINKLGWWVDDTSEGPRIKKL